MLPDTSRLIRHLTLGFALLLLAGTASGSDFFSPDSLFALGKITRVHRTDDYWRIELTSLDPLVCGSEISLKTNPGDTLAMNLVTGLPGVPIDPDEEWIGKTALFLVCKTDDTYSSAPDIYSPPSPNGCSFFVFEPNQQEEINSIKRMMAIINLTDADKAQEGLIGLIEAPSTPLYLSTFAMEHFARLGLQDHKLGKMAYDRLLSWRDNITYSEGLRLGADMALSRNLPSDYELKDERIAFLNVLRTTSTSPEIRHEASHQIDSANQLKNAKPASTPKKP